MDGHRVGGDVDAYCTKCRMMLGHTVLAMVGDKIARVRCNTCMGEHAFRAYPPGTKAPKAEPKPRAAAAGRSAGTTARTRATREKAEVRPFEELFADRDTSEARTYSPRERFEDGDLISHPTFGLGLVRGARQDKVDVIFKAGEKVLVHNLAGGVRSPVSFARPARREGSPELAADKPPPGEATGLHAIQSVPLTEIPASLEAEETDEP